MFCKAMFKLGLVFLALISMPSFNAAPQFGTPQAIAYLARYGFLQLPERPSPIVIHGNDGSSEQFDQAMTSPDESYHAALRAFQRRYQLPETGQLDSATARMMLSPRCGNRDIEQQPQQMTVYSRPRRNRFRRRMPRSNPLVKRVKRFLLPDAARWSKKNLTWQIRSYPSKNKQLTRSDTQSIFQHVINMWSREADVDFREELDYYRNADIIIEFGSKYHGDSIPFDGEAGVLAHAFYPTPDDVYSFSGDAHFDDDEHWNAGPHNTYKNLISVAAHELGHSMGLGHSEVPSAIMFPYYLSSRGDNALDPDDIKAIQTLYGAANPGKLLPNGPKLPIAAPPDLPPPDETVPNQDFCNISVDAIVKMRNLEHYVFDKNRLWRVTWSKTVSNWISYQFRDGPAKITYYWPALPDYVDYVDGGLEREDGWIYIFRGNRFWLLEENSKLVTHCPKDGISLSDLGLPRSLAKIDTIFRWGENKRVYILASDNYWLLDEEAKPWGRVEQPPDYPKKIHDAWVGVPLPVQAAFTQLNGETLFFKGNEYYEFDNIAMRVRENFPKQSNLTILGCFDQALH